MNGIPVHTAVREHVRLAKAQNFNLRVLDQSRASRIDGQVEGRLLDALLTRHVIAEDEQFERVSEIDGFVVQTDAEFSVFKLGAD